MNRTRARLNKVGSACSVLFVRVTPGELAEMHDSAKEQNRSLNSYARSRLGLPDRRGYRYRNGATNATQESAKDRTPNDQEPSGNPQSEV
ncbi:hypothetical protein VN12_06440 [Pirellula sp. SH-Sr6A]|uniref:hypothetical protein n=1 Tax=Pirellula sp. SH-Sr6A TaxID=1632865 RepID=UPI00078D6E87|nr:hypothetical protein [Pirellula sp. SH-Sr6A]AMV31741.1 hypothetical protein VN12_06440 [Pirellula sp. SH-Sr6A]